MYEKFGPKVDGGSVTFQLFFPDSAKDPSQYVRGGLPEIREIKVVGTFQSQLGQQNWVPATAPAMALSDHPKGFIYTYTVDLAEGYYEYKFFVTFNGGSTRWCNDPCTKYSGQDQDNENSGFVIGGNKITKVSPLAHRLQAKDLVIYEVMLDDFAKNLLSPGKAPLDILREKISHLKDLGINTVELMPITATLGRKFSWGYNPFLFFAVEDRYTNSDSTSPSEKLDKLYRLQKLIEALHEEKIQVIMDGVFNHAEEGAEGAGFPYYWLYKNPKDSPFTGDFGRGGYFKDLDYANGCTQEFIFDVCKYWIEQFGFDGIRFDYTLGFIAGEQEEGIRQLINYLQGYCLGTGNCDISYFMEHLTDNRYECIGVCNDIGATGAWYDPYMYKAFDGCSNQIDSKLMRAIDSARDFEPCSSPVIYNSNHDHSTIVNKVAGSGTGAHLRTDHWFKTQPWSIGLLTMPGAVLLQNGQEYGEEYYVPESGNDRVSSRPLNWARLDDSIGQRLYGMYKKLLKLRNTYPGLRSMNFYPRDYHDRNQSFNSAGYGADTSKGVVIFHRWGKGHNGEEQKFIVCLNFSKWDQDITIPFSSNGKWQDILNEEEMSVNNYASNKTVNSNWGRIFFFLGSE